MTDEIDLATVTILNSPDVRNWTPTSTITRIDLRASGVHVEHTGRASWPAQPFGVPSEHGACQFTLWIFLFVNGQWFASGVIDFPPDYDENGGNVFADNQIAKNWLYAADRWGPMFGHQPAVGERVGFMVTAGDTRNNATSSVLERSQVVTIAFPAAPKSFSFGDAPAPAPTPVPEPPTPDSVLESILVELERLVDSVTEIVTVATVLNDRLEQINLHGIKVHL